MKMFEVSIRLKVKAAYPEHALMRAIRAALDGRFETVEVRGKSMNVASATFNVREMAVCQNCEHVFEIPEDNDFATIPKLNERVAPGEILPVCECVDEECRALAHPLLESEKWMRHFSSG